MGRKTTLKELKEELALEREWMNLHKKSSEGWMGIIKEMEEKKEKEVNEDNEWKTRYNYQCMYNSSLRRQIKKMRSEARQLRTGVSLAQVSAKMDRMSTAKCRQHIKHLKTELISLRGLCMSNNHQLDEESAAYIRAHEEIQSIVNDVWFKQATKIEEQERMDRALPTINVQPRLDSSSSVQIKKPDKLPPITKNPLQKKSSYLQMYEKSKAKRHNNKAQHKSAKKKVHFSVESDLV
ncbi:uncharacterized protein LOC133200753 [Saccostrea echinata]|uniref:uncharacterized protein LOC133189544 n=1 Tax=Saccostrea echinata TaxID=191078 RepID=UPI002A84165D|nr:uncharacterized protein LOC133189544 [Saccostrea echinata]XP_061192521.1 uncharacterized protein LOC133200753 [Saccostrea echinata]